MPHVGVEIEEDGDWEPDDSDLDHLKIATVSLMQRKEDSSASIDIVRSMLFVSVMASSLIRVYIVTCICLSRSLKHFIVQHRPRA